MPNDEARSGFHFSGWRLPVSGLSPALSGWKA
jgi:hypothetical protein